MASTFICPKGHSSADNDFCSECGAKIQNAPAAVTDISPAPDCPDCGAPAPAAGVNFCEICGYNFGTQRSGEFPHLAKAPPKQTPPTPQPVDKAASASFKLVVAVDPTLRNAGSPEAPRDTPPLIYSVDKPSYLIGRKSEVRAIFPEIALDSDAAVSHRHGVISQTPEGLLVYRDLGSANGTRLNGADLAPLVDKLLGTGDELTLGHWTRITVTAN